MQKKDQVVEIVEVIVGGPVWKAKALEVGDVILKVAQKDEDAVEIGPMRLSDAVKLIKGPKGTQVYLTVKRVSVVIEEVIINRDVVELEESYAKSSVIQRNEKKYGFIQLPKFYIDFKDHNSRNAASDVKKELLALKKIQANVVRLKVVIMALSSPSFGSILFSATISKLILFFFISKRGIKYKALRIPQIIKVQLEPCQKPLIIKIIKIFLIVFLVECTLPPIGIYK